jgi:hypothetical protein
LGGEIADVRPHQFSSFDKERLDKERLASPETFRGFEQGLVAKDKTCPTLSEMGDILASRDASRHRFDAHLREQTAVEFDPEEQRKAVSCVWDRFHQAVKRFGEEKNAMMERVAEESVKLALAISEKIMNHQAKVDPELMKQLLLHALQKVNRDTVVRIRFHPKDIQVMKKMALDTTCLEKEFPGVVFEADETLTCGDCLVETPDMNLDVGVQAQLAVIEKAFASLKQPRQADSA